MSSALVGYTGFVGRNLLRQALFDACYASANIDEIAGQRFDRMVVTAVPASMWMANHRPDADLANIEALMARLAQVEAARVVLISTIAVYAAPGSRPDERSGDGYETERAYGRHRRMFEAWVVGRFARVLVVRLPALFGPGLTKNFIFDLLNPVPSFVPPDPFAAAVAAASPTDGAALAAAYGHDATAGVWRLDRAAATPAVAAAVAAAGLSAARFTNPASMFQFYDLDWLWGDIERATAHGIGVLNLATEPMSAANIAAAMHADPLPVATAPVIEQDFRTIHSRLWGRSDGYVRGANEVIAALRRFQNGNAA
jgi:nucleoside-diphosphate-sugar epimerase